jgi:ankyrin repeat protein
MIGCGRCTWCEFDVNGSKYSHGGERVLTGAAKGGHTDTLYLLLDHGSDINVSDCYCRTALIQAARRGHIETVNLLIDRSAGIKP